VHGATRLAAAQLEGWTDIDAQVLDGSEVDFEKAELAENLHRSGLTRLQRDRQIARYIELCEGEGILRGARAKKGRGGPEGGLRAAAREMKLPESTARDAMKAAKITDRSAAVINNLGLANSPSAYQAIAAERTTKAQIAKAREIANSKQEGTPALDGASVGPGTEALLTAWKEASQTERRNFLKLVGFPWLPVSGQWFCRRFPST
jgi:hypothetical protein